MLHAQGSGYMYIQYIVDLDRYLARQSDTSTHEYLLISKNFAAHLGACSIVRQDDRCYDMITSRDSSI